MDKAKTSLTISKELLGKKRAIFKIKKERKDEKYQLDDKIFGIFDDTL